MEQHFIPAALVHKISSGENTHSDPVEEFTLWVDETKWKQDQPERPHLLTFLRTNGEAGALIISGRLSMPTAVLRDNLLNSGREADPNARITFEEKRIVNGRPVIALELSSTMEGKPYKFFGYLYGGSAGV